MSDLSPDAKNLWERAKKGGFEPSDAQIDRVRQAVLQRIAAQPSAPHARPSSRSFPKWAKVAGVVIAVGAVVATGMKLRPRTTPAPVAVASEPQPTVVLPEVTPPSEVPSATEGEGVTAERAPSQSKASNTTGRASGSARSASSETQADTLPDQVRIISEARVALRERSFAQALTKVNEYESRYPKGVFLEEQLAIRALSLCGLGRDKEAVRARDTLERTVPNSRQLERVRSSCAGGKTGP
jgi:hypothetical protein